MIEASRMIEHVGCGVLNDASASEPFIPNISTYWIYATGRDFYGNQVLCILVDNLSGVYIT